MTNKRRIKNIVKLALGIIPLFFIVYLIVGPIVYIIKEDILAKNMYVISDYVNVRTKPYKKALKMGKVDFGTEFLVYNIKNNWAEVLIEGQRGFVFEDFIGKAQTFYKIDGLFGDDLSKKKLSKLDYKIGVINYLDSLGFITNIKEEYKGSFDEENLKKEIFQIFSPVRGSRYSSVAYSDFDGDFVSDVALVLKNINTKSNHLVILSFDKKDPRNKNKAIFSMDLMDEYYYIKLVKKRSRKFLENEEGEKVKKRIPINGISIGTNRNRNLNDTEYLLIYNGEKFELIDQTPPEE